MTLCNFRVFYSVGDETAKSKTTVTAATPAEAGQKIKQNFAPSRVIIHKTKKVKQNV